MKRLIIQYDFPKSGKVHPTNVFPNFRRSISFYKDHLKNNWLPELVTGDEKPTVNVIPVGFFFCLTTEP